MSEAVHINPFRPQVIPIEHHISEQQETRVTDNLGHQPPHEPYGLPELHPRLSSRQLSLILLRLKRHRTHKHQRECHEAAHNQRTQYIVSYTVLCNINKISAKVIRKNKLAS